MNTKVRFENSVFNSINGRYKSVLSLKGGGHLEVVDCTFANVSSYERGGVLHASASQTYAIFINSVFLNNTALQGAAFHIESQSLVECYN